LKIAWQISLRCFGWMRSNAECTASDLSPRLCFEVKLSSRHPVRQFTPTGILSQREFTKPRYAPVPLFGENRQVVGQGQYAKCDLAHWDNKV
jgi:hypothetical protein